MHALSRALRCGAALAVIVAPPAVLAYGCGSGEATVENLCGWIGDPNKCFREFAREVGSRCGTAGVGSALKGQFLERSKLDTCILEGGGAVMFDPPPDLNGFPLQTIGFKVVDKLGLPCLTASIGPVEGFSIAVEATPDGGATGDGKATRGGTFSATAADPTNREVLDTTCPSGETHHFNKLQLSECPNLAPLVPRAEIESAPGSLEATGFLRVRIFYPPTTGELSGAKSTAVEYFDCTIPKQPPICADGQRNIDETDVDCGGSCGPCGDGARCLKDADCISNDCIEGTGGVNRCAVTPDAATSTSIGSGGVTSSASVSSSGTM